ncbi:MAG TPA: hypothetical protein VMT73_04165 [Anaerolineales bacterium]|nr:hypothetical protein [Anaerolineales bacterium]
MSSPKAFIARVFFVALILRVIPVILSRGLGIGLDDMFQYDMLARSIVSGNGYRWYTLPDLARLEAFVHFDLSSVPNYDPKRGVPTSFRAPLYPVFLALVYAVSGTDFTRFFAARLAQAILLGAPLAPLTYLVSRKFLQRMNASRQSLEKEPSGNNQIERASRTAASLVALYPILVIFPLGLGTENLFFPLILLSILFLLKSSESPTIFNFLFSGFLLGLTALTRSIILLFVVFVIFWIWFSLKEKRGTLLTLLAFALTIAPWIVRNSLLYGHLTGIETSLGYNLYVGYHPLSTGTFTFGPSLDLVPILSDSVRDHLGMQKALEFIQADPARFPYLALRRLGYFFNLELRALTYFYSNNLFGYIPAPLLLAAAALFGLPFAILTLSAVFGVLLLARSSVTLLFVLLFIGYLLPHVFILSEERFHLTLIPFFAILAAQLWTLGLPALKARFRTSRMIRLAFSLACLVALLLIFNWTYQFTGDSAKYIMLLGPYGNQTYLPY